jgi:flagellar basal-body rod modification protein FlgD
MSTIPPVSSTTPASAVAASASSATAANNSALASLADNTNTFLTLLTTQLKNQDPLSPLDTNQFMQQLVSLSQVEQQINTNTDLTQLIKLQTADETIAATPLIGQTIQYNGATAPLSGGQASFSYTLPSAAAQAALIITDANGNTVFTANGDPSAGQHDITWNGQTPAGVQLPDGNYTLQVVAATASGTQVPATIASSGKVAGVSVENGTAEFDINGMTVPMSALVSVQPKSN